LPFTFTKRLQNLFKPFTLFCSFGNIVVVYSKYKINQPTNSRQKEKKIMTMQQTNEVKKIQGEYLPKERTKLDELKALDKKVKFPAEVFAYSFGSAGALVLGTGMCLAMKVIGNMMGLGIAIGLVGIGLVTANYFLYKKILKSRKSKYAKQINELAEELLSA
jgi:hypothetical protein